MMFSKDYRVNWFRSDSFETQEVLDGINRFAGAFQAYSLKALITAKGKNLKASQTIPDPLQHLLDTVADFVTPGDLLKCGSLHDVGRIVV